MLEYNVETKIIKEGSKTEIHQWQHQMNEAIRMESGYQQAYMINKGGL